MQIQDFPSNLIIWAVGAPIMIIFGLRALSSYKKLKSPLSKYLALTGLLTGFSWLFWSLPFLFLDANQAENKSMLVLLISVGDVLLFSMLALQVRVYWYLRLQNVVKFIYVATPTVIVALVGLMFSIKSAFDNPHLPMIVDGSAVLPTSRISHLAQAILIAILIMTGFELLKSAAKQNNKRSKFGSISIGLLYITGGSAGAANVLFDDATNSSPLVILTYSVGLVFFALVFMVFRIIDIHKSRAKDL